MNFGDLLSLVSSQSKKEQPTKNEVPKHWIKCSSCQSLMYYKEVENKDNICPKCGFHMRIGASARIKL